MWQEDKELKAGKRVQRLAHIVLLLMALLALFALITDTSNYIRSVKSVRGLSLDITNLQVIDDDNPRARIRFRVRNDSPLKIEVESYAFELYLNEERVGSSYSTYLGTDPNIDPKAYRQTTHVNQILAPGSSLDLEFTLYVYSVQMESVRNAQRSGSMSWRASASFSAILPYAHKENVIKLLARFEG